MNWKAFSILKERPNAMLRKICKLNRCTGKSDWRQLRLITQINEKSIEESNTGVPSQEWANARPFSEIPGPSSFEIFLGMLPGNSNRKPVVEFFDIFRKKYGDIFLLPGIAGKRNLLMSFNLEDFPTVIRSEGNWPRRPGLGTLNYHRSVFRKEDFGDVVGLVSSNDEAWGKFRSAVNPILMQPKNARLYVGKMLEVNNEFLQRIREIRDPSSLEMPDNFEEEINRLTFESVAVVALNKQIGLIRRSRDSEDSERIFGSLRRFFELSLVLDFYPSIWKYFKTPTFYEQMKNFDTINEIIMKYINEAVERIENDKLSSKNENEDKSVMEKLLKIDKKIATVMALDLLMAGVDTTSSTLVGILLCIAKNPDKQEKLRQEVKCILPQKDSVLTIENMKNLPYLRACIKEGIRMYPIGSGTMKTTSQDIVISGYQVPKNQDIILNHNILINEEKYCPKAKEYIPERWLREEKANHEPLNPFLYMPFSYGPRSCVGKRIVEIELEITMARLVRNFYIEFNYPIQNAFKTNIINVPAIPLKFKFSEVEY